MNKKILALLAMVSLSSFASEKEDINIFHDSWVKNNGGITPDLSPIFDNNNNNNSFGLDSSDDSSSFQLLTPISNKTIPAAPKKKKRSPRKSPGKRSPKKLLFRNSPAKKPYAFKIDRKTISQMTNKEKVDELNYALANKKYEDLGVELTFRNNDFDRHEPNNSIQGALLQNKHNQCSNAKLKNTLNKFLRSERLGRDFIKEGKKLEISQSDEYEIDTFVIENMNDIEKWVKSKAEKTQVKVLKYDFPISWNLMLDKYADIPAVAFAAFWEQLRLNKRWSDAKSNIRAVRGVGQPKADKELIKKARIKKEKLKKLLPKSPEKSPIYKNKKIRKALRPLDNEISPSSKKEYFSPKKVMLKKNTNNNNQN